MAHPELLACIWNGADPDEAGVSSVEYFHGKESAWRDRQCERCECESCRGEHPLAAVKHVGDGGRSPDWRAGLKKPQLFSGRCLTRVEVSVVVACEQQSGRR